MGKPLTKKRKQELEKLETEDTKYCIGCKKVKPLFEFAVNSTGRKFAQSYCSECKRESQLQRLFGITSKDYSKLLEKQNGKCKICRTKTPKGRGRFHVDHCHVTDKIRGLLCSKCNHGLGQFNDNIKTLASAIQYLINSRK